MNLKPRQIVEQRTARSKRMAAPAARGAVATVAIDSIVVDAAANPRRRLRNIEDLATSVRTYGLLQPLVVRRATRDGKSYQLVAGHRRFAAMKLLAERF